VTKKQDKEQMLKCGMVSIIGRPNVGKSTLLNQLVGAKVAIVSNVPQTTRNQIRGIYTDERGQIIFIDTPGIHAVRDRLDDFMNKSVDFSAEGADCVIHLVDTMDRVGEDEERLVKRLAVLKCPIILGLNKVDMNAKHLSEYIKLWESVQGRPATEFKDFTILPLSAKTGIHMEELYEAIFQYLPEGPMLYPEDALTDMPKKMAISDIIREKFYYILKEELPHSIAVVVESLRAVRGKTFRIEAVVYVERDSQKKIIVGHQGSTVKRAGAMAREDLEELLGQQVFLDLHVKVQKGWRDNDTMLLEMGYDFL